MAEAKSGELSVALKPNRELSQEMGRHRTLWQDAVRRFMRNRLAVFGLVIVVFLLFLAIFADLIAPFPYDKADFSKVRLLPMRDPAHPLGTDEVGRDYLSRLIYGARTSMTVGISIQLIALLIGVPLGGLAGYLGGKVDFVVTRIIEIMTAFPGLLFSILVITLLGGGLWKVIFALSITSWIGIARLTRGQLLSLREKEYVEAARALGVPQRDIIFRHLMPNALSPLLIAVSFGIPTAIFGEAGLSFLGIGVNDPIPSWGKMVGVAGAYVRVSWHMALFPTLAIALTMLGFSFVGDGLRDALDPNQSL
ncbi:ABC transporter permease [Litorilinea aerophila]|nr:ABC transporter permease [Litorilinea aerophila]MCC9077023.1 ABC transporter permease [Litorilinea aerophila]GIV76769.1 MAG: peptide ABC transporter permease [Litorilinea sp.]